MKATTEQQLGLLERNIFPLLKAIRSGYTYDPGSSDLDDEQPIIVRVTLGDYRRANRLYYELGGKPEKDVAQEHLEKCCACNYGKSPCEQYKSLVEHP